MLTPRELATVLAALRHWQRTQAALPADELLAAWPQLGPDDPLTPLEIDALCELLNEPCGCEAPGPFCCGIPGILARIDIGGSSRHPSSAAMSAPASRPIKPPGNISPIWA